MGIFRHFVMGATGLAGITISSDQRIPSRTAEPLPAVQPHSPLSFPKPPSNARELFAAPAPRAAKPPLTLTEVETRVVAWDKLIGHTDTFETRERAQTLYSELVDAANRDPRVVTHIKLLALRGGGVGSGALTVLSGAYPNLRQVAGDTPDPLIDVRFLVAAATAAPAAIHSDLTGRIRAVPPRLAAADPFYAETGARESISTAYRNLMAVCAFVGPEQKANLCEKIREVAGIYNWVGDKADRSRRLPRETFEKMLSGSDPAEVLGRYVNEAPPESVGPALEHLDRLLGKKSLEQVGRLTFVLGTAPDSLIEVQDAFIEAALDRTLDVEARRFSLSILTERFTDPNNQARVSDQLHRLFELIPTLEADGPLTTDVLKLLENVPVAISFSPDYSLPPRVVETLIMFAGQRDHEASPLANAVLGTLVGRPAALTVASFRAASKHVLSEAQLGVESAKSAVAGALLMSFSPEKGDVTFVVPAYEFAVGGTATLSFTAFITPELVRHLDASQVNVLLSRLEDYGAFAKDDEKALLARALAEISAQDYVLRAGGGNDVEVGKANSVRAFQLLMKFKLDPVAAFEGRKVNTAVWLDKGVLEAKNVDFLLRYAESTEDLASYGAMFSSAALAQKRPAIAAGWLKTSLTSLAPDVDTNFGLLSLTSLDALKAAEACLSGKAGTLTDVSELAEQLKQAATGVKKHRELVSGFKDSPDEDLKRDARGELLKCDAVEERLADVLKLVPKEKK